MSYEQNELQNLAYELSSLFEIEKSLQLGRPYRPHPKSNKNEYWLKAATNCKELEATPLDFIKSAFSFTNIPGGPFPTTFGGKAIARYYKNYAKSLKFGKDSSIFEEIIKHSIKSTFQSCCQRLRRTGVSVKDTLNDNSMPFPAYVRLYLLPGDIEIEKKYKAQALKELVDNPALVGILKKLKMDIDKLYE
jgi:hypothetical protein